MAAATRKIPVKPARFGGRQGGQGRPVLEPRVDWRPLSAMLDLSDRSDWHSGRPSTEQVPRLEIEKLKRLGAEKGALLHIKALDGPIEAICYIKGIFRGEDGGEITLAWDYQPEVGAKEARTIKFALVSRDITFGHHYFGLCPHCGERCRFLYYAVATWACGSCLTIRHEANRSRDGGLYTAEKAVRLMRRQLGVDERPLSPVILGITSRKKKELAERLYEAEMKLMAKMTGTG